MCVQECAEDPSAELLDALGMASEQIAELTAALEALGGDPDSCMARAEEAFEAAAAPGMLSA